MHSSLKATSSARISSRGLNWCFREERKTHHAFSRLIDVAALTPFRFLTRNSTSPNYLIARF